jgi:hypothetical protein
MHHCCRVVVRLMPRIEAGLDGRPDLTPLSPWRGLCDAGVEEIPTALSENAQMQPAPAERKPKRARYARGIQLPRVADGRSQYARRFRTLVESFVADLGGDPSAEDAVLIRQTAHLVLTAERLQAEGIDGADVDVDELIRINSETRRNLAELRGKAVKTKPTGPTLADFLASRAAQDESDEDAVEGAA